jgi:hypothetical protein
MKFSVRTLFRVNLFLLTFLTGVATLCTSSISAQSAFGEDIRSIPQGTFVSVPTALLKLNTEIANIQSVLAVLNHGTQDYRELEVKYVYFDNIRTIIIETKASDNTTVPTSIVNGLNIFANEAYGDINNRVIASYKKDAITLLKI